MEAVDTVEPENDGIKLVSIFGDQKFVNAKIYSLSLVEHKVFLKE
jgi:predicted RNA-binding protein